MVVGVAVVFVAWAVSRADPAPTVIGLLAVLGLVFAGHLLVTPARLASAVEERARLAQVDLEAQNSALTAELAEYREPAAIGRGLVALIDQGERLRSAVQAKPWEDWVAAPSSLVHPIDLWMTDCLAWTDKHRPEHLPEVRRAVYDPISGAERYSVITVEAVAMWSRQQQEARIEGVLHELGRLRQRLRDS